MRVRPLKRVEKLQVYMLANAFCLSPRARCLAIILRNNIFEKPAKVRQLAPMGKPAIEDGGELKEDDLLCGSALRDFGSEDYLTRQSARRLWLCCP
jgi:hypothetical protein